MEKSFSAHSGKKGWNGSPLKQDKRLEKGRIPGSPDITGEFMTPEVLAIESDRKRADDDCRQTSRTFS